MNKTNGEGGVTRTETDVDSRDILTLHDQEQGTGVSSSKGHRTICLTFLELP